MPPEFPNGRIPEFPNAFASYPCHRQRRHASNARAGGGLAGRDGHRDRTGVHLDRRDSGPDRPRATMREENTDAVKDNDPKADI